MISAESVESMSLDTPATLCPLMQPIAIDIFEYPHVPTSKLVRIGTIQENEIARCTALHFIESKDANQGIDGIFKFDVYGKWLNGGYSRVSKVPMQIKDEFSLTALANAADTVLSAHTEYFSISPHDLTYQDYYTDKIDNLLKYMHPDISFLPRNPTRNKHSRTEWNRSSLDEFSYTDEAEESYLTESYTTDCFYSSDQSLEIFEY